MPPHITTHRQQKRLVPDTASPSWAISCILLVPGQTAELVVWQRDQYGNKVTERAGPGVFLAHATGPGAMQSDVMPQDPGKVIIK